MAGPLGNMMEQLKLLKQLMSDERVRALITHPKVQQALMDPEIQALFRSKNAEAMAAHPKMRQLLQDPELAPLFAKLNPNAFRA